MKSCWTWRRSRGISESEPVCENLIYRSRPPTSCSSGVQTVNLEKCNEYYDIMAESEHNANKSWLSRFKTRWLEQANTTIHCLTIDRSLKVACDQMKDVTQVKPSKAMQPRSIYYSWIWQRSSAPDRVIKMQGTYLDFPPHPYSIHSSNGEIWTGTWVKFAIATSCYTSTWRYRNLPNKDWVIPNKLTGTNVIGSLIVCGHYF